MKKHFTNQRTTSLTSVNPAIALVQQPSCFGGIGGVVNAITIEPDHSHATDNLDWTAPVIAGFLEIWVGNLPAR